MKIQVRVGALAHGGSFVGDIVNTALDVPRKKVFIRNAAPGELVSATIIKEEKNLIHAVVDEILETSSERIHPPCPWFGVCGGCDLQHLTIQSQREAKRSMVERSLQFQGKLKPRLPVELIGSNLPDYEYRRRISLHVNSQGEIGFYRANSGEVVDIHACLLANKFLNAALIELRPHISSVCRNISGVTIEESGGKIFYVFKVTETKSFPFTEFEAVKKLLPNLIVERDSRVIFSQHNFATESAPHFPAGHFSQVNEIGNQVLIAKVLEIIQAGEITELYAGAGNFSIPLAQRGNNVTAIEADPALIQFGRDCAAQARIAEKINFVQMTCEKYLQRNKLKEVVLLDPPRSGAKALMKYFDPTLTKQIVYVSCSLPTLTRDLKDLVERGYKLESVAVLDMFSQTHHVETISHLQAL